MARKHDVVVVGAGPAGAQVATLLAEQGFDVVAIDRKRHPGAEVCCTGIVGGACVDLLGLDEDLIHDRPRGATLFSPSGRSLRIEHEAPVAAVVDREKLERRLVARGQAAGAAFRFGATVTGIAVTADEVRVAFTHAGGRGTLTGRVLVLAAGHGPNLLANLGLRRITDAWIGAQVEVGLTRRVPVTIFTDQALAPGGFAWLVPTGPGRGLAGLVARRMHDPRLDGLVSLLASRRLTSGPTGEPGVRTLPLKPMRRTVADRVLVVGAAAGQVKPTTGGGIYYGSIGARIAAEVLDTALRRDALTARDLEVYETRWRDHLGRELSLGYLAHVALDRMTNDHLDRLFLLARKKAVTAWVGRQPPSAFDWHGRHFLDLLARLAKDAPGHQRKTAGVRAERCRVP